MMLLGMYSQTNRRLRKASVESQVVQQEALTRLLVEKGVFIKEEFLADGEGGEPGDKGEKGCKHDPITKVRKGHKE